MPRKQYHILEDLNGTLPARVRHGRTRDSGHCLSRSIGASVNIDLGGTLLGELCLGNFAGASTYLLGRDPDGTEHPVIWRGLPLQMPRVVPEMHGM